MVESGDQTILAGHLAAGVLVTHKPAERKTILDLELQIGQPGLVALLEGQAHFTKRISVKPVHVRQELLFANHIARGGPE